MSQQIASKFISLVPTNGTEFTVQSGQKLIFELNPSLGLVKGRDSYLTFDVLNNSSDKQRLMLNNWSAFRNNAELQSVDGNFQSVSFRR